MRCPCRKVSETTAYGGCCGRYHAGIAAPTAEALMRSRYSAYALGLPAYLRDTWHAKTRPATLDLDPEVVWFMLKVSAHTSEGDQATVSFVARSRVGGQVHVLAETSRFVREDGRWYYVQGV